MSYQNPTTSRTKPLEGVGIFKAKIHFKSIWMPDSDPFIERILAYEYLETVNGLEVFIENPRINNASSLEEDLRQPLKQELKDSGVQFDTLIINFYEPK